MTMMMMTMMTMVVTLVMTDDGDAKTVAFG